MALSYDPEHARTQQVTSIGGSSTMTYYFNDAGTSTMTERVVPATGTPTWKTYILADGHIVGQRNVRGATVTLRYFVLDQLGSVASVADEIGALITNGHQSYDAWGRMRNTDGTPDSTCSLPSQSASTRGFTGQEEMPGVCLVNYNARLYDPQIGRFLGADPTVEAVYYSQDLDRYTYVGNNPLSLTDPTGLCFLGCSWKSPLGRALPFVEAQIGITVSGIANASIAGGIAGFVATGRIQSALLASAEAFSFAAFAPTFSAGLGSAMGSPDAGAFVANGFIGGLFSVGHKGGFLAGFMAAGFSSLADTADFDTGSFTGNVVVHATLGGVGSVLGGGKFQNGAATGAFSYAVRACVTNGCEDEPQYYKVHLGALGGKPLTPAQMQGMLSTQEAYLKGRGISVNAAITLDPRYVYLDDSGAVVDAGTYNRALVASENGYILPGALTYPGGWFSQDRIVVFASAFYGSITTGARSGALSAADTLNFILSHEYGHVSTSQGGGGCGPNEDCADAYAMKRLWGMH
jgi:RHS repeat-associated protein